MRRYLPIAFLLAAVPQLAFASPLGTSNTDVLQITAIGSGDSSTITDCVSVGCENATVINVGAGAAITGDSNPLTGMINAGGTFDGWTVSNLGISHSPVLSPVGLDVSSLTASCISNSCPELVVTYSDINFDVKVNAGGFSTTYSGSITGNGVTTQSAWVDSSNTLFGEPVGGLIGTLGPFGTPFGAGTVFGGPAAGPGLYSLTIQQTFTDAPGGTLYSVDGNVTGSGVPEPASLMLLGSGLLGLTGLGKRKFFGRR
jgi:hypothetical protein